MTFDPAVLNVGCPVLVHKDAKPTWKWFSAEHKVSILYAIAKLKPKRIIIGGLAPDAIPIEAYQELVNQFPTPTELKRYTLARVSSVVVTLRLSQHPFALTSRSPDDEKLGGTRLSLDLSTCARLEMPGYGPFWLKSRRAQHAQTTVEAICTKRPIKCADVV